MKFPFGAKVVFRPFRPTGHKGPKFAPRREFGLFAGHFLQTGGHWKGEYLVISFEQLIKATGRIEVKRVRECALAPGPVTLPLKTVGDIQIRSMRSCARHLNSLSKLIRSSKASCLSLKRGACFRTTRTTVLRLLPVRRSILCRRIALLPMILVRLRAFPCASLVFRGSTSQGSVHRPQPLPKSVGYVMICSRRSKPKARNCLVQRCMPHMNCTRLPRQSVRPESPRGFQVDDQICR